MKQFNTIIIGAGAAGLMCAIEAGERGRTVLLIDHARTPAEKVRISGGGRCNFTNVHTAPQNFLSGNKGFCISALKRFSPQDFIARVDAAGIPWHEKALGQLFCDDSSDDIIQMLLNAAYAAGVRLMLDTKVSKVSKTDVGFEIKTFEGNYSSEALVIACGGRSIPKMGATGFGYEVAAQFGLDIIEPRPGLVPLTFDDAMKARLGELTGIAVDVVVKHGKTKFKEALLFTHRGLSGPAILQISSFWREGDEIEIDLAPGINVKAYLEDARKTQPKSPVRAVLSEFLPKRLAVAIALEFQDPGRLAEISAKTSNAIAARINAWRVRPQGSEGYRTAEVTLGGVDTKALSSKTMEVHGTPGLYFIGEVVDVTGHLGGFNFQWAWASGFAAGQAV